MTALDLWIFGLWQQDKGIGVFYAWVNSAYGDVFTFQAIGRLAEQQVGGWWLTDEERAALEAM